MMEIATSPAAPRNDNTAKSPCVPLYERGSDELRAEGKRGKPTASPFIKSLP